MAAAGGLAIIVLLWSRNGAARPVALLRASGPWVLLALLPFFVATSFDALGWLQLIKRLGKQPAFVEVLRVRFSLEAIILTLPGGSLVAESSAPALLANRAGMPVNDAVVAVAARRWMTLRSHALYIAAGALVGWGALRQASPRLIGRPGLGWLSLALAIAPLAASLSLQAMLSRGSAAHALQRRLSQLPGRAGRWFAAREAAFAGVDVEFRHFARGSIPTWPALAAYAGSWLMESVETWTILRLLGAGVPFATVLAFEPVLSLLRSAAFFAPAGWGVQDLGYVAFLGGGPVAVAFVAMKRLKELAWAAIGWALLAAGRRTRPQLSAAAQLAA
ncbi:MAG TPA: lysylphosphatidylglycerol synthase domain-containing protein [Myxococcales bacterium]|nr:lysylphosphatidylglycerol synthase domain-containing protein [Myxococcales bacterium]